MTNNRRVKRGWMSLKVVGLIEENHDTRTLILVNEEEQTRAFDYLAGQYLTFRFDSISEKPVVRSYTMSSSPVQSKTIAVTVKEVENGFVSNYLCRKVKIGDVLRARGPIGKFCYDPSMDHKHLKMVAAGSGVTPFISIMREFEARLGTEHAPLTMSLLVSFRSKNDLICWNELSKLQKNKNINIVVTLSRQEAVGEGFLYGRINEKMLSKFFQDSYSNTTYMTCGPEFMMQLTREHLLKQGVPEVDIKMESFS